MRRIARSAALGATLAAAIALVGCAAPRVGSVGAILERSETTHAVYVHEAPDGLAAARAGLRPGDEIVMVDGVFVRTMDEAELRRRLRGEIGSEVELTVVDRGGVRRVRLVRTPLREPVRSAK